MDTKLYNILQRFSKIEMNRLEKYVNSPYFNRSEAIMSLFQLIIKNIESKKPKTLDKLELWEKLHPGAKYEDARFRKYNSDLLRLVEGYMAQQIYDENPLHQAIYLMDAVARKKIDKLHYTTIRAARDLSEQQEYKPATYYFYQYQIEKNLYVLTDFENKRDNATNVEKIINSLDKFYLAEKLKYYLEVLSRQNLISYDYEVLFIEEILQHLEKQEYLDYPPIAIYYQVYLMNKDPDNQSHYYKFKELIDIHIDIFPPEEAYSIYRIALNYCIKKVNKGSIPFMEEYIRLYETLLNKKEILEKVELTSSSFRNTVVAASRLKMYSWAENFIKKFQDKLPIDERFNTVSLNLATVYFYQKKYDEVERILATIEYPDAIANLSAKSMLLATYYEQNSELLYSFIESYRIYVSRQKSIADGVRLFHSNLTKYVKKLTEVIPSDKQVLINLKEEIENNKNVASRNWLLEKVEELQQRR